MPEEIRRAIDGAKAGEKDKRKKVWEDKFEAEGITPKRRKKEEPGTLFTALFDFLFIPGETQIHPIDSESQTPNPTTDAKPKPKGPIKYPIDDLDVVITDREKKAGKQLTRPKLNRDVPFGKSFEPFLMSWAFFQSFGYVLSASFVGHIVNPLHNLVRS